mgnify:FL=1
MPHPPLYLSPPAVLLPATRLTNEQVIARVRENYRGNPIKWPLLEAAMRRVLERCGTSIRYFEEDHEARVGDYAARAANLCLQTHRVASSDISLLIYGGVAREYFEPATAMEVAAKCGLRHVHAFDVTSACAGQLEGIHIAASYLSMHDEYRMALIGSAELTRNFLCFDIQTVKDLLTKAAGLTIGNAASAWLLGRQPFAGGSLRLLGFRNHSMPTHWHLCSAPIDGTFTSLSTDLFKLNEHVAPEVERLVAQVGWKVDDVDHFVFHQPSESILLGVLDDLGVDRSKGLLTHHLYANAVSTTVSLALHELLKQKRVRPGDKLVLGTAAAGFSMVSLAGVWEA